MARMNFDLEDGLPRVSFDLKSEDAERFCIFMAECTSALESEKQILEERDRYHDMADELANAIAEHFNVEIGEHSNMNCPWENALEWMGTVTPEKRFDGFYYCWPCGQRVENWDYCPNCGQRLDWNEEFTKEEMELLKHVKSERGRERIKSILSER